jgi:protein required for attachment to host cells
MSRKKTHQGVEMRSTWGMREEKTGRTWLILMNQTRARVYEWRPQNEDLDLIRTWDFPEGKMKGSDLISDQPGRVFSSQTFAQGGHQTGAPRHSYSSRENPKTNVEVRSVRKVVEWIEKNRETKKVSDLVCVAEPRIMGIIQKQLDKKYHDDLTRKWEKDFSWLEEAELRQRLFTWLTGKQSSKKRVLPRPIGASGLTAKEKRYGA